MSDGSLLYVGFCATNKYAINYKTEFIHSSLTGLRKAIRLYIFY